MPQPYGIDWSPDGLFLAYGDIPQNRVILVNTATGAVAPLAGTDDFTRAHSPQFSADGSALYFWGRRGDAEGIWRVPPTGGVPVLYVADAPADAHISANGEKIAYAVSGQVLVQDVASGAVDDIGQAGGLPRMSPDGRRVAFIDAAGRLAIFSLATRALRTVAVAATPFTIDWSPLGAWLLVGGSSAVELVQLATLSVLPLPNYLLYPVFRFVEETVPPND
jgi:Tol biopolymer transport system component